MQPHSFASGVSGDVAGGGGGGGGGNDFFAPAQRERSSASPTGFCLNSEENSFRNDSPTLPRKAERTHLSQLSSSIK